MVGMTAADDAFCVQGVEHLNELLSESEKRRDFWIRLAEECLADLVFRWPDSAAIREATELAMDMCLVD